MPTLPPDVDETIRRALTEDLGTAGDVTTNAVVPSEAPCGGHVVARAAGVIAGLAVFERCFALLDRRVEVKPLEEDGSRVEPDERLAEVRGPARAILSAERVALNFLTHLSGVATATSAFVDAVAGTGSHVLCTRKTLPGLRALERYAVECGGGRLHRAGLFDGVLIKDNHVAIAGGVAEAVRRARASVPHTLRVEVEVETLEQLQDALEAGADAVLLDNADLGTVSRAAEMVAGRIPLEVSGGVRLETIGDIARTGELLISVGRITHSAPALDISLDLA